MSAHGRDVEFMGYARKLTVIRLWQPSITSRSGESKPAHPVCPSTRWETIMGSTGITAHREPWNKGKIVGQGSRSSSRTSGALRVRLQMEGRLRELALFNLGIDSKLRGCDLVALKVRDVCHGDQVASRAVVMQHKTPRPVQFEITQAARDALQAWIKLAGLKSEDFPVSERATRISTSRDTAVHPNPRSLG